VLPASFITPKRDYAFRLLVKSNRTRKSGVQITGDTILILEGRPKPEETGVGESQDPDPPDLKTTELPPK
jgi:hypothetical protein